MKVTILTLCFLMGFITFANAGAIYNCIDRDGNKTITDTPEDGMKCMSKESSGDSSPYRPVISNNKTKIDAGTTKQILSKDYLSNKNTNFIQNQTLICRDYISQSMKREFPVNGLSAAQLMYTACTKKEIADNLSEQENNHLKGLTTKLDNAKKKLSQRELGNLKEKEKLVNDNWEWLKKSVEPPKLSQITEQEIKSLDSELRLIFKKMSEALKNGDIETALTYFHHWSKERHRKMFSALPLDMLKKAASENQELHLLPFRE